MDLRHTNRLLEAVARELGEASGKEGKDLAAEVEAASRKIAAVVHEVGPLVQKVKVAAERAMADSKGRRGPDGQAARDLADDWNQIAQILGDAADVPESLDYRLHHLLKKL